MIHKAVTSFFAHIARIGGRFLAQIAVSAMATLCVSLGLSGYLSRESPALPTSFPPAFTLAAPLGAIGGQIGATASTLAEWRFVAPANARGEDVSSASAPQASPSEPAAQPAPRAQPHQARARTHVPKPACAGECAGRAVAFAHAQPAPPQALAEVQPVPPPAPHAALLLPDYAADGPLPPLPIPAVAFEAQRPGLQPIARAANLLTNLVGRW